MGGNSLPSWCVGVVYAEVVMASEFIDKKEHLLQLLIEKYKSHCVAEVGVAQGNLTARVVKQFKGQLAKYICVDPWIPYPEWSDRPWKDFELSAAYWEGLAQKVYALQKDNPELMVYRMLSVEAAKQVGENYLDGVYLDGIHDFPNFVCDVWSWLPKIAPGGFISGHDYVKRFLSMIEAADMIFGKDLRLDHSLGGSWFVHIPDKETKDRYLDVIRHRVGENPEELLKNPPDLFGQKAVVTG